MGQGALKESSFSNNKNWKIVTENQAHPFYRINPFCNRTFFNQQTNEYVEEYVIDFSSE